MAFYLMIVPFQYLPRYNVHSNEFVTADAFNGKPEVRQVYFLITYLSFRTTSDLSSAWPR